MRSSWLAPVWPAATASASLAELATTSRPSASRTALAGPQHRGPGRHQCRQELSQRRDSIRRLFYDTIKGGDFRAREANVYRLAQVSNLIIDHCVAQGIPFAREYGACWPTAPSAGPRCPGPFTPGGRPASSSCWGLQFLDAPGGQGPGHDVPPPEMLELVLVDARPGGSWCAT